MRSFFWWGRRSIPIVVILSITACNSQSASQKLNQEIKTVSSWAATAHLTGESWLHQDVPAVYAKQTLEKTQDELKKEIKAVNKIASLSNQSAIQNQLQQLQSTIASLASGIDQHDRQAVTQSLQELSNQEKALHSLSEQSLSKPTGGA